MLSAHAQPGKGRQFNLVAGRLAQSYERVVISSLVDCVCWADGWSIWRISASLIQTGKELLEVVALPERGEVARRFQIGNILGVFERASIASLAKQFDRAGGIPLLLLRR